LSTEPPRQLLALLDDSALAAQVIELSSVLAQLLQRPLEIVYVESSAALLAAALPFTQVLPPAGGQWMPLEPPDVERGYRSQAARLRALIERVGMQRTIEWSLRVVRGALAATALEMTTHADLMLVAGAAAARAPEPPRPAPSRARRIVAVIADGSAAGQRAQRVAQEVAKAIDGVLSVHPAGADAGTVLSTLRCDLLVLPRPLASHDLLTRVVQPTLLVA
jgi:hypothetical protein